ncbi:type II secretion system ATPase GspE [Candidatus Thiothrix sp. Deng01]|uniref:Type II secretion system protein E n=1 Tax=Candidatus Thiothrix phosphatis TaxID=3112415 RepID=A0ABU6CYA3_9GAMM|nr:type II secretion system ATPase GspE [Candidatus Thiothrix sp. Deng01]MEB4591822.1 type II secretion system ATPase GspE [Candidatus Thiothrix sp. Deng01]
MSAREATAPDTQVAEPAEALSLPYSFAKRHGILLQTGVAHPQALCRNGVTPLALTEVQRLVNGELHFQSVDNETFDRLLAAHYDRSQVGASMMQDIGDDADLQDIAGSLPEPEDLLESEDDAPIIRLINALLTQAVKEGASDIHIETFETRMSVRMRVDGILREIIEPPRKLAPVIISRIKVMARLDIAEKRLPQDGRISLRIAGRGVDVRVSTLPSGHTERVVLRLLDKQAGRLNLSHLGMEPRIYARLQTLIEKPHGIVLVTGPTGSGKTTTLYAALTHLNDQRRNILTVEDPIEYYIDGIGQTQVNSKVDMTFARGLRAILRQDPDVVMVGEIRDLETAEIAVQASLTGHLVFSTLHTNTAIGAVTRLQDMGVEPYLLASSLLGVVAQRLVRLLCPECKQPAAADDGEMKILRLAETATERPILYRPVGCHACNHSGFIGRVGIYELVELDDGLRQMIHDRRSEMQLDAYARQSCPSIREDGVRLVLEGRTSLDEVLRVTREDSH